MILFAMATVVGPRLLVSLRDARALGDLDESERETLNLASGVLVREIRAIGDVAARFPAIEDVAWQANARSLATTLDAAGNAESFGVSR
jgi:CO/xanthine dehydrogenase FAD-binding subunit